MPFERILDTGRFEFEKAQQHPLWFKELYGFADHVPETEEYGVDEFRLSGAPAVRARKVPRIPAARAGPA